jgi:putative phosphoesterase
MRVAVLSDTHLPRGSRALADAVLAELAEADLILHAGDVVAAPVLRELARLAAVAAVAGNMDDADLRGELPERRVIEIAGARIGMIHDPGPRSGREARLVEMFPDCAAVVYGHTHVPQVDRLGETWILNPGSPTERRRAPRRSMIRLEVDGGTLQPRLLELS